MDNSLLELQSALKSQGVLICFSGKFSQEIIEELGEAVKKYLETEEKPKTDIYNTFSIFVEQTQNIKKYCTHKQHSKYYEEIATSCIVTIGRTAEGVYISSGNIIEKEDTHELVNMIESLIPLDKAELKKKYKAKLREDMSLPDVGGAGIGLIDMARKASKPLDYVISEINDEISFFTLKAVV